MVNVVSAMQHSLVALALQDPHGHVTEHLEHRQAI